MRGIGLIAMGCLLSGMMTAPAHARHLDEIGVVAAVNGGHAEQQFTSLEGVLGLWRSAGLRRAKGEPASSGGESRPHTSLLACLKSPASLLVCIEAGVVSIGKVAVRYEGKGKDLVRLLLKWGGKVKRGGKGSHMKIQMPSGRVEIVPDHPARGTVEKIIQRALKEVK